MHGKDRGRSNYSPPSSDHQPHTDQIHQRLEGRNQHCSYWNFWHQMILQGISPVQCIENNLLIHTFSAAQCLVKPLAMYHPQIVAPLMPLVHTASALCHKLTHLGAVAVISRNSGAMSVFAFDPPPWLLMNVTAWRPHWTFGHFVVVVTIRRTTCAADKCPTLIRPTSLGKSRIPTESDIWIVFFSRFE